eukprot:6358233-Pyramimonas_sp.AAC.1
MLLGFAPVAVNTCRPGGLWLELLYVTRRGGSKYAPLRLVIMGRAGARARLVSSSASGRPPPLPC